MQARERLLSYFIFLRLLTHALLFLHPAPRKGRFAYVFLLAGRSATTWEDYTRATLVAVRGLLQTLTKHEIVVMVPSGRQAVPAAALHRLGALAPRVRVVRVGPVGTALPHDAAHSRFDPAVQALYRLKLRALQLVEYEKVAFLDTDVLVHKNMDALFAERAPPFTFVQGSIAPLNSGFFLATPSCQAFADVNDVAQGASFDRAFGWQQQGAGRADFWAASVGQGLLHYEFFGRPGAAAEHGAELLPATHFAAYFTHFRGLAKPWLFAVPGDAPAGLRAGVRRWQELAAAVDAAHMHRNATMTRASAAPTRRRHEYEEIYGAIDPYATSEGKRNQ